MGHHIQSPRRLQEFHVEEILFRITSFGVRHVRLFVFVFASDLQKVLVQRRVDITNIVAVFHRLVDLTELVAVSPSC